MIIEVWSDVVCPWCFIGRRRLQKAIAGLSGKADVEVIHRAFQLDPTANETISTQKLLSEKYRVSAQQVAQMQANVCEIADGEGLCYNLSETLSGNTKDAHRLLIWSKKFNKQDELLEAMYSSYFENSGSLFDHQSLAILASSIGLEKASVLSLLSSDELSEEVDVDQATAHQFGANGVPFYVVDRKYAISGAQPQEIFDQTLVKALTEIN
jgi:predicted DsbA family dithiol-disulfide isomerase